MSQRKPFALLVAVLLTAGVASLGAHRAQMQQMQKSATSAEVTKTFTIEAIDYEKRLVALKDSAGNVEMVVAGPQIQRFGDLKVGDKVTFRYQESLLYSIRPTGTMAPSKTPQSSTTRDPGPKPAATYTEQVTASVVVTGIDDKAPSITVRTDDDKTMTFKVDDKKKIANVKVGDHVDVTYRRALAVRVEAPK